jgi:hydroxyacylglutathione hydrolase
MNVEILASRVTDNFFYLLHEQHEGVLIDPIDSALAIERVQELGLRDVRILVTHGHGDHVGGNDAVVAATGAKVLAPARAERFPCRHDVGLSNGDRVRVGTTELQIRTAPGHTDDHLIAFTDGHLFCGDVLFFAGVGNCRFGGHVDTLYRSVMALRDLPDHYRVYPGHDYAGRNLDFAFSIVPEDHECHLMADLVEQTPERILFESTLGQERRANLFLRVHENRLQDTLRRRPEWASHACEDTALTAFRVLRALRDQF